MASEAIVDVSYRGLVLGKRVRLLQVGPRSAYVAHDAPMPVGTELILTVDETLAIPVQVARVREGDPKEGAAGMWLWADAADERARAWWEAHVTAEDPRIPEPGGGRVRTEAPASAPEQPPAAVEAPAASAAPAAEPAEAAVMAPAAAADGEPQPGHAGDMGDTSRDLAAASAPGESVHESVPDESVPDESVQDESGQDESVPDESAQDESAQDEAGPDAGDGEEAAGRGQGRHVRGTQVMTAVEIADVLGMDPVVDSESEDAVEPARVEPRTTHVMSAVEVAEVLSSGGDAPRDDAAARGKARGKRRARKRR